MVLKRPALCLLLGFNSWTAIQAWIAEVVAPAHAVLVEDWLKPAEEHGWVDLLGSEIMKEYFVQNADELEAKVQQRVWEITSREREEPLRGDPNDVWDILGHYERFIIDSIALDRIAEEQSPSRHHIANKEWSRNPETLFGYMYELTDTLCHNYWKPAETDQWNSDDSDVPYTDPADIPGAH